MQRTIPLRVRNIGIMAIDAGKPQQQKEFILHRMGA